MSKGAVTSVDESRFGLATAAVTQQISSARWRNVKVVQLAAATQQLATTMVVL